MSNKSNISSIENLALLFFAYPGVAVRYLFYGTKRSVRDLLSDGLDINAFAFLWLFAMGLTWTSILSK